MFNSIIRVCKNVKKLDEDKIFKEVFSDNSLQHDIADLNTQDQLYDKGIDSKGVKLGDYAASTIVGTKNFKGKIQKGQRYDHITLKDTGEFYASVKVKSEIGQILITADTKKGDKDLSVEFGKYILGLTNENLQKVRGWTKPMFIKNVRKNIFK